jgi:hypothetical protein
VPPLAAARSDFASLPRLSSSAIGFSCAATRWRATRCSSDSPSHCCC